MKYIISYNTEFGAVSAESKKPEDLVYAYRNLKALAEKLESNRVREMSKRGAKQRETKALDRKGSGETARILREIETRLLNTGFFSRARTTGETKDKLFALSHKSFTSRKVSQALGILWRKRDLRRVGKRNYYAYSK
ncbi:MAG: hypothetical protein ACREBQ_04130 [Nitrososphaerales archaeon]